MTPSRSPTANPCLRQFQRRPVQSVIAALALVLALQAHAAPLDIDLPAQPLAESIKALARQAGMTIAADEALLAGKRAPAVRGMLESTEALRRLLLGSGLETVAREGTWLLRPAPQRPAAAPTETTLQEVQVRSARVSIAASEDRVDGYLAEATGALGVDLPMQQLPASVSVVSADFLRDSGTRKLTDILNYVPGVTHADNGGTPGDSLTIRGFGTGANYFNGMRQAVTTQQARALDNVERVEVVKGPAGFEAAVSEPGGFVNIITKKPLKAFALSGEIGAGDYGYRKAGVDVSGPFVEGGSLQYRLIASHEELPSWRPGRERRPQDLIAPSLNWDYAPGSRVLVEYERLKTNDPLDRGTLYIRGAGFKDDFAGRDWSMHQAFDSKKVTGERFDIDWTHRLDSTFSLNVRGQDYRQDVADSAFSGGQTEGDALYLADGLTWNGTRAIPVYFDSGGTRLNAKTLQATLRAEFEAANRTHRVQAGVSRNEGNDRFLSNGNGIGALSVSNSVDLFQPDNRQTPQITGTEFFGDYVRGSTLRSVFGQWLAEWTPAWRTLLSLRRDRFESFFREETLDGSPVSYFGGTEDRLFSWRLASSYDLSSANTAFVGVSNSHVPQGGVDRDGAPIDALRARSMEAGLKSTFADGRVLWANTLYSITQDNITACDPIDTNCRYLVLFGKVRVRGFESELTGRPTQNLQLSAGLSVQQSTLLKNSDGFDGNRFANTPRVQASVFGSYRWAAFGAAPLTTRLGVYRVGQRFANSGNTYVLPGYTRVDAGVTWAFSPKLALSFNVENLLDATYYTAAQDSGARADQVGVGNRRLMQLALRASY